MGKKASTNPREVGVVEITLLYGSAEQVAIG